MPPYTRGVSILTGPSGAKAIGANFGRVSLLEVRIRLEELEREVREEGGKNITKNTIRILLRIR
jgi:hypothetical protein